MAHETDLRRVKLLAHALLDVRIQQTAFSPMIVSHPFTNSGITALRNKDGSLSIVDLVNNADDCTKWRSTVGKQIDSPENAHEVFALLNPPYYLTFIKFTAVALSEQDLGKLLSIPKRKDNAEIIWHKTSIRYMLSNERYVGDSLWQKTYMTDAFPPVMVRNRGEKEMYYAEATHPAIITKEEFDAVQMLLGQRAKREVCPENRSPFDQKVFCGQCGTSFRKKVSHGKVFWSCRKHNEDIQSCPVTQVPDAEIRRAFLRLHYNLKIHGEAILTQMLNSLQAIRNRRMLWSLDVIELNKQISELTSQNQMLAALKEQGLIDPDFFISQNNELTEQLRTAKLKKERLLVADGDSTIAQTRELMEILDAGPDFLDDFDAELFGELIDKIIVDSSEQLRFRLKNGLELVEIIERTVR